MSISEVELARARLRWRARRGLLENDLILTRFLDQYEEQLSDEDVLSLTKLFQLDDNQLLEILLGKREPEGEYYTDNICRLVQSIREA
jgi:antitoxin CptB